MSNVNIKFNGKDYILSCDDCQEDSLKKLAKFLNNKYDELQSRLGNIGENKLLLITTIQLIDEHFELREKILSQKDKLDKLSSRFNEMKNLAIKYKDSKDNEIKNLNLDIDNFKKAIQENNELYEGMLDRTAKSLEKIIENTGSISKIQ